MNKKMKYPKCTLASIITPGVYCVVSQEEEHVAEVKRLEKCLTKEIQNASASDFSLKCQMCVAVETPDGKIKRGVIEERISNSHFEILLIDYGETLIIDKPKIHIIKNEAHINVEPLSFTVKLFGVFPSKFCMVNGQRKARVTQNWQPQSEAFVQNLFANIHEVIVQSILINQRIVYGDIFLKAEPKKYTSLRKLLYKNEFCAYSKANFLRHEGLDLPLDDISEVETKMEFVKKWQRENFGDFQCHTDQVSPYSTADETLIMEPFKVLPSSSEKPAFGRGKIKHLLAQMKNLQAASSNSKNNTQKDYSSSLCSSGTGGKGKQFLEGSSNSISESNACDWNLNDDGRFDDVDFSQNSKDAVVKTGECSLPSDANLTEDSSNEDVPPPLVRKNSAEFVKREQKSEIRTNSQLLKNSETSLDESSDEVKMFKLEENENWFCGKFKNGFTYHDSNLRNYWTPFVKFSDSVVKPVNTFSELPIQHSIILNLEKGGNFHELNQVQRWAIPAIRKQHNTIILGGSKTGKTLSYLVPLIDYVQDESYFEELPDGNGPIVVILASSSRVCESIYYMCHALLGHVVSKNIYNSKIRTLLAHGNGCEKEVWVKLTNGCDILISTPHCLARLLEHPVLTNFERLGCLVLDEIDVISEKHFKKQLRIVLEKAKLCTKNRHYQKIFCGERWTPYVKSLVKDYVPNYALIIGSYLEAIIYERLKPTIYLVLQDRKAETLLEKLKDKFGKVKILVVCENTSDAVFVDEFLTERKISSLVAHEDMMADKLKEIGNTWRARQQIVLVLTDGVLNEMKIREAQVLVHYGLPVKSKTNFFLRYSAFENFLRETKLIQNVQNKSHSSKLIDIILVDDENHFQLPHIVDFVVRLGGKVSDKVLKKCEEIRRVIEVSKTTAPICKNLLTFGRCRDPKSCPHRHAFVKSSDSPLNLPSGGWVNFSVIKVYNATTFSVRLFEHVDAYGKSTKLDDRFLEIPIKLTELFKNEENRRPHGIPSLGEVCAVKSEVLEQEVFYRAQVVEYLKMDKYEKPVEVRVRLLDRGDIWTRKSIELYELPKALKEYPPAAVDMKVAGLQPLDFDVSWSQIANGYVKDIMTRTLEQNQYWSGKIVLALKGTLFLNPVKRKQFLPHLNTHVFDLVLQQHLISNRVAIGNEEHIPTLVKLCLEGEIETPSKEEMKREDTAKIQPQWAFFDSDFAEVKFLAASHTSSVFLQPKKFEKLLEELEEECQIESEKMVKEMLRKGKKPNVFNLTVGVFCLAKFEDGKWNRGRIEKETDNGFDIFFIDHGDFLHVPKSDVIPISQSLLLRLPCQAIECSLIGTRQDTDCPTEVLQDIYEFSDDGRSYLYASVIEKTKSELIEGRKYCVNLLNQKGVSLNKSLVDSGKVLAEESERKHLMDVEIGFEGLGDEHEEEIRDDESEEEIVKEENQEVPFVSYFEALTDDIFNSEEGFGFLKEFSSKCLLENEEPQKHQKAITNGSDEICQTPKISASNPEEQIKKQNVQELLSEKSRQRKNLSLIKHEKVLTPQILWSQSHTEVKIKIVLENVLDYSLGCTATNLSFRCFAREKLYAVDMKLYGAINPQMTKLTLKAFHVVIILRKLVFPLWPRLYRDEGKHPWVNLDVESLAERQDPFADKIKSVKRDMENGVLKEGVRDVKIRPCSDSEEMEDEFESESDNE